MRGGLIVVGEINLGGSLEAIHNPVQIAEIAIEKGASGLLMPVACRRQLIDLSDDMRSFTHREIAERLGMSVSGVRRHCEKMLWKNGCNTMLALIAKYKLHRKQESTLNDL